MEWHIELMFMFVDPSSKVFVARMQQYGLVCTAHMLTGSRASFAKSDLFHVAPLSQVFDMGQEEHDIILQRVQESKVKWFVTFFPFPSRLPSPIVSFAYSVCQPCLCGLFITVLNVEFRLCFAMCSQGERPK